MGEAIVDYVKWVIERFPYEEPILDTCAGWEPNYYQPLFPGKRYIKQDMQDFDPLIESHFLRHLFHPFCWVVDRLRLGDLIHLEIIKA